MPNCNTLFSEEIRNITAEEKAWLVGILRDIEDMEDEERQEWADTFLGGEGHIPEYWPYFEHRWETDDRLALFSEDSCIIDNVITLIEMFLARFRHTQEMRISWAETCSRPVVGGFGGGSYTCNPQNSTEDKPTKYLIFIQDDIEPWNPIGPFSSDENRQEEALDLRRKHGRDHGIYALDIRADGMPVFKDTNTMFVLGAQFPSTGSAPPELEESDDFWLWEDEEACLVAGGYEWECPRCNTWNAAHEVPAVLPKNYKVKCIKCGQEFGVFYAHQYGSGQG